MAASTDSLLLPVSVTQRPVSPVANRRLLSRSPQPYRRGQPPERPLPVHCSASHPPSSPEASRAPTCYGGSDSGTEADDELTRRLPAPPARRRISSEDDVWGQKRIGGVLAGARALRKPERSRRLAAAVTRRVIELGLAAVLVAVVLFGRGQRGWVEVLGRRKEIACWLVPYLGLVLAYPLRVMLRNGSLQLPRSLDPATLLYPTLFPVLIALSLTGDARNPFLLANLVVSISNLPPLLARSWDLQWVLSLLPLISAESSQKEALSLIMPINTTLTTALTNILHPSLTQSELRLLSSALINLLFHASSPQAVVLRALLWGGGIAVFVLCEDVVRWNVGLARVPIHRFRRVGNAVIGAGRFRRMIGLRDMSWKTRQQASDSEGEVLIPNKPPPKPRKGPYFATLTGKQARDRRVAYAGAVYTTVLAIVFFGLRPYIGEFALDGQDPFLWAPGYIFCGQGWYQRLLDRLSPGMGYCVTGGSTEAANVRLRIIVLWAGVLTIGITFVTLFGARLEVDTRRKVFHGMIIPMFLIPGLLDPPFTHLCLSLAVAVFLLCDLVRAGQLPPASRYIARFLQPYVDGRDLKGPMVVSHVFLLVGVGIGWWLTLAAQRQEDWDWEGQVELAFSAGVVCVGLGDAAASLVGRRVGRHKWGWKGGKSLEGSLAFTVAVVSGLSVVRAWIVGVGGEHWGWGVWARLVLAASWGSMLEAVATGVNDNVVVPIGVWALVRGLGL